MRRRLPIFCFITISLSAFAGTPVKKDTLPYPIKTILINESFRTDSQAIDTSIQRLHFLNPVLDNDISYQTLTRNGYPILSNNILTRFNQTDYFFPANYLLPYLFDSRNIFFCDTRKQFSNLSYKEKGEQNYNEEFLQVIHTQNLTVRSNLGIFYNLAASYSKNEQKASDHSLNLFYHYTGKKYLGYYQFYLNSFSFNETGGIANDLLINYTTDNFYGLGTNLKSAKSEFKRMGFNTIQELKLNLFLNNDSDSVSAAKDYGSIFYQFNFENNKKSYFETVRADALYENFFSKSHLSNDSVTMARITNKVLLNSPQISKYLPNLRVSVANDLYYSNHGMYGDTMFLDSSIIKTGFQSKKSYFRTYTTVDFSQSFNHILWNVVWNNYFLGYGIGDQNIKISTKLLADKKKTIGLFIDAISDFKTPSFFFNNYYSNHQFWENGDQKKEKMQQLSVTAKIDRYNFDINGSYTNMIDYVYFDQLFSPKVASPMHILSFSIKQSFAIWKFSMLNKILYQKPNTESFVHVPELSFFNSTDFKYTIHFFTGGKLFTQRGADTYYTTSYYLDAYMPSTGVYYLQDKVKTTGYPRIDAHLTMKIKNVSFFFKYSHVNAKGIIREFSAVHYPLLPMQFSYGINWLFYD